jgi:hypothetical protein
MEKDKKFLRHWRGLLRGGGGRDATEEEEELVFFQFPPLHKHGPLTLLSQRPAPAPTYFLRGACLSLFLER